MGLSWEDHVHTTRLFRFWGEGRVVSLCFAGVWELGYFLIRNETLIS